MQNKDLNNTNYTIRCESLYRAYYKALKKYADQILGDPFLAEDAFQQTFLRILMYPGRLMQLRQGKEWLYLKTVMRNVCFEILKERKAVSECERQVFPQTEEQLCTCAAEDEFLGEQFESMLEELPESYRIPLRLHYVDMYSYEEIGKMCHIKPLTLRKRAQRGRRMLAEKMRSAV